MLKLADLVLRPDFRMGPLSVSPARRLVEGPAGKTHVEPLIMQVFLLLLDAGGKVVTRNELFDQCWGGVIVGDDSLNRAIAKVRRIGSEVAPGLLEVETIPRTGYRLTGDLLTFIDRPANDGQLEQSARQPELSRRALIGAGAALAVLAGGGLWWSSRERRDPRSQALSDRARQIMRSAMPGADLEAAKHLRAALEIEPGNPKTWGTLALALRNVAEVAAPGDVSRAVMETEAAARRALALDPKEPDARTALATLRPEFGNWAATEDALREILKDSPDHVPALTYLVMLLQSVGRARESFDLNERTISLDPLSPVHQFRRGLKLWILGRVPDADLAIDRALQLWPDHLGVWNARLMIFAFTGRAHAALASLNDEETRPPAFPAGLVGFWQAPLIALQSRSQTDISAARESVLRDAPKGPAFAVAAMMVLSSLGQLDDAFAVAEGALLRRGPLIGTIWAGKDQSAINDQYWRRTMNLFTPATAAMRADLRFKSLCEGIGMMAYWRSRGIWPDPMFRLKFG